MAFMRKSKFRHVFGKGERREQCYDAIRITKTSWESTYCAVNPKFLAVITDAAGGGAFLVLPLSKVGRIGVDQPFVVGHRGAVFDIQWCPHDDNIIASASDDCSIKVWQIPDSGLTENLTEPLVNLYAHQKRVVLIAWHPSAENVLASAGSDFKLIFWNLDTADPILEVDVPEQIFCISFSPNGSRLACTAKDKMLRIINTHTGDVISEGKPHVGSKPAQVGYLNNGQVITTGFSRMSDRQCALWNDTDLSSAVHSMTIDDSNGVMFIFPDLDTNMIYLVGKGDTLIRYYEVTDEAPYLHFLHLYQSSSPQRGMGIMPKRGLNVNSNEISRFYKLHNTGLCEVITFTVPRKSELFQDDLYPDTAGDEPALTAEEFFAGKDAYPLKMSLKDGFKGTVRNKPKQIKNIMSLAKSNRSSDQVGKNPPESLLEHVNAPELMLEVDLLKTAFKAQQDRILALESRLSRLEHPASEEECGEDVKEDASSESDKDEME